MCIMKMISILVYWDTLTYFDLFLKISMFKLKHCYFPALETLETLENTLAVEFTMVIEERITAAPFYPDLVCTISQI